MNRRYFFRATLGSLVGLAAAPVLINLEKQRRIQKLQQFLSFMAKSRLVDIRPILRELERLNG